MKSRKTKRTIPAPVWVRCRRCGESGSTNRALGYKQGQWIEQCRNCC